MYLNSPKPYIHHGMRNTILSLNKELIFGMDTIIPLYKIMNLPQAKMGLM